MSTETLSPPVFETAYGRIVSPHRAVPELGYGFVLHEQAPVNEGDIHAAHTEIAKRLLVYAGIAPRWGVISEYSQETFPDYSPRHVDGLAYEYFQVHTTHSDKEGGRSLMELQWYDLSGAEHEIVQQKYLKGFAVSGSSLLEAKHIADECADTPGLARCHWINHQVIVATRKHLANHQYRSSEQKMVLNTNRKAPDLILKYHVALGCAYIFRSIQLYWDQSLLLDLDRKNRPHLVEAKYCYAVG